MLKAAMAKAKSVDEAAKLLGLSRKGLYLKRLRLRNGNRANRRRRRGGLSRVAASSESLAPLAARDVQTRPSRSTIFVAGSSVATYCCNASDACRRSTNDERRVRCRISIAASSRVGSFTSSKLAAA
jgi:hypothetical protein